MDCCRSRALLLLLSAALFFCKHDLVMAQTNSSMNSLSLDDTIPSSVTIKPTSSMSIASTSIMPEPSQTELISGSSLNSPISSSSLSSSSEVLSLSSLQSSTAARATVSSVMVTSSPGPMSVFEDPIITYGNNTCEAYIAGGKCQPILEVFPTVITNFSRSDQHFARVANDRILTALETFGSTDECISLAVPLLCRYSFPTCDPALEIPTYQPVCRRDCQAAQFFVCKEPWELMVSVIRILNLTVIDQPNCEPLEDPIGGDVPMCVSTVSTYNGEIPLSLQTGPTCYSGHGRGYNGTINVTRNGLSCQRWDSTYPHQHLLSYEDLPELDGGHNYCRNPGERGDRPWCFTTDPETRWDYCDVPECSGATCENYMGDVCRETNGTIGLDKIFINKNNGRQRGYESAMISLLETVNTYNSECRDLFTELLCATNFPTCDMTKTTPTQFRPCRRFCERTHEACGDKIMNLEAFNDLISYAPLEILFNCSVLPDTVAGGLPECFEPIVRLQGEETDAECYSTQDRGFSYEGTVRVTSSGKQCQRWGSQTPHQHTITPISRVYLDKHNYCRNPEQRGERPWCYTTDPDTRWEYCDIPRCDTPEPTIEGLPQTTIIVVAIVVPVAVMLAILLVLLVTCLLWCCSRTTTAAIQLGKEPDSQRYVPSVQMTSINNKDIDGLSPLYARNPLTTDTSIEYDGIKLPELPRDSIVYSKDLGQGHFGVVVQAEAQCIGPEKKPSTVAVKVLKLGATPQVKKEFFREAALMQAFDHPNILKLFGVCIEQEPLCMIFEFMERGDLNNFLRQNIPQLSHTGLTSQQLVEICIDIASGLEYLAQNHYVHRDLATRNCLVSTTYRVKIADFGLSQDIYSSDYFTLGDTELLPIRWMPPEAILYAKFTTQSDVWSFGVVLWEIFSFGIQPYYTMSNEEVVHHVRDGNVMSCPENCPSELYDLMIDCWAMNPSDRPTAAELHLGLRRWSPNLSALLQVEQKTVDYQNMAVVREYAQQNVEDSIVTGDLVDIGNGEVESKVEIRNGVASVEGGGAYDHLPASPQANGTASMDQL